MLKLVGHLSCLSFIDSEKGLSLATLPCLCSQGCPSVPSKIYFLHLDLFPSAPDKGRQKDLVLAGTPVTLSAARDKEWVARRTRGTQPLL